MNCSMTFLHPYWFIFWLWTVTLMACDGNDICFCMVSIRHHCSAGGKCQQVLSFTRRRELLHLSKAILAISKYW